MGKLQKAFFPRIEMHFTLNDKVEKKPHNTPCSIWTLSTTLTHFNYRVQSKKKKPPKNVDVECTDYKDKISVFPFLPF